MGIRADDFTTVAMTEQLWAPIGPLSCMVERWLP